MHEYKPVIRWTGNTGNGTSGYRSYERSHIITAPGKPDLQASSDPAFRGDTSAYNPEELFVASLSSCHMLWFLHLCADAGVIITSYIDNPVGLMEEGDAANPGHFVRVTLQPKVDVLNIFDEGTLLKIHHHAHRLCFIANSVNFDVEVIPE